MHYNIIAPLSAEKQKFKIPKFAQLVRTVQVTNHKKLTMFSSRIPRKPSGKSYLQPIIPLILPERTVDEDKTKIICLELKTRAGGSNSSTYKKFTCKFEMGDPYEWIELMKDIEKVWTQNSISGATDRASTVRALLRGESLDVFETSLIEGRGQGEEAQQAPLTVDQVNDALEAVAKSVFPHRALHLHKNWMSREIIKPEILSTKLLSAAIGRLNNSIPYFPGGSEEEKFTEKELLNFLENALPSEWRAKFDLDGYIPTDHSRPKLIAACEAIERSLVDEKRKPLVLV